MKKLAYKVLVGFLLVALLLSASPTSASAITAAPLPAEAEIEEVFDRAVAYLASQMNSDGGIRWFDETSNVAATIKVVQALAAAGRSQDFLKSASGFRPMDFLGNAAADWVNQAEADSPGFNAARAGQMLTAIAAADADPHAFGPDHLDLVYDLTAHYDPNTGVYGNATSDSVLDQAWAILGLTANALSVPAEAVDWLAAAQLEDGSWDDGFGSYLDTTPLAVMALVASGERTVDAPEVQAASAFMMTTQQPEGGWQNSWDTMTNANTTAVMLQAISAIGEHPIDDNWQNPYQALLALQQEDGAIGGDFANAYSTADAILGLSGQTIYTLSPLWKAAQAFDYIFAMQDANGGWESIGQTLDTLLAISAAGWDPETIQSNGVTPLDYLQSDLDSYVESGPDASGKAILALVAMGEHPQDFYGVDVVAALQNTLDVETGAFGAPDNTWHQALAILALQAADEAIPEETIMHLTSLQLEDGSWEYAAGFGAWPDSTALAVQALLAADLPEEDPVIQKALDYLQSMQTEDGGWGDASTTSYVMMALNDLSGSAAEWMTPAGKTPKTALLAYQKANGAFVYSWDYPDDNLMATTSSLIALFSGSYQVSPQAVSDQPLAVLVIDPGDQSIQTACVPMEEDSLSGLGLLDASGFPYEAPEGFIDSILEISNPEGETNYWSYWYWDGREWAFHNTGAAESQVLPGAIEAWHFTSWEVFPSLPPEVIPNLTEVCGTKVLKNYVLHPYLTYTDLHPIEITEANADAEVTEPIAEATEEATPTEFVQPLIEPTVVPGEQAEGQSNLPIILIVGLGVIVLVAIVVILTRKQK